MQRMHDECEKEGTGKSGNAPGVPRIPQTCGVWDGWGRSSDSSRDKWTLFVRKSNLLVIFFLFYMVPY